MNRTALVTGAGRGIGLEMCRQLAEGGTRVLACPRRTSDALEAAASASAGRIAVIRMDVDDEASVRDAAGRAAKEVDRIDVLFNNAGIYPRDGDSIETLSVEPLVEAFRINAVGPLRVVGALLPLLRRGLERRLVQTTSLMGSIGDNSSGGSWAYRMSKAALNMAVRNLAHELGPEGFVAIAVHPGWVKTRMGGAAAPLELEPATREVLRIALAADPDDNGAFLGPGGTRLPW